MLDQALVIQPLQAPFPGAHVMVDQDEQAASRHELEVLAPDPPPPPAVVDPPAIDNLYDVMLVPFPIKRGWRRQVVARDCDRHAIGPEAAHRGSKRTRRSSSSASGSASRARRRLPAKRPFRRSSTSRRRCGEPPAGAKRPSCSTTTGTRSEAATVIAVTPDSSTADRLSASSVAVSVVASLVGSARRRSSTSGAPSSTASVSATAPLAQPSASSCATRRAVRSPITPSSTPRSSSGPAKRRARLIVGASYTGGIGAASTPRASR